MRGVSVNVFTRWAVRGTLKDFIPLSGTRGDSSAQGGHRPQLRRAGSISLQAGKRPLCPRERLPGRARARDPLTARQGLLGCERRALPEAGQAGQPPAHSQAGGAHPGAPRGEAAAGPLRRRPEDPRA